MIYPKQGDFETGFFREHGWLVVENAIPPEVLVEVSERCEPIPRKKHKLAFDWAWEKGKAKEERTFKIVQGSPTWAWPDIVKTEFRAWMRSFGSTLMGYEDAIFSIAASPAGCRFRQTSVTDACTLLTAVIATVSWFIASPSTCRAIFFSANPTNPGRYRARYAPDA